MRRVRRRASDQCYERDTANTCILHLGSQEMMRICTDNDEPHLMKEMTVAVNKAEAGSKTSRRRRE